MGYVSSDLHSHIIITAVHRYPDRRIFGNSIERRRRNLLKVERGIGTPDQVREHLEVMEDAGVDQVVFIQQAGANRHEDICESLELFSKRVLPDFKARDIAQVERKNERLAEAVKSAEERRPALTSLSEIPVVDAYPVLRRKLEEKASEEDGGTEISDDGEKFLLSIEGGKRTGKDA